MKTVKWTDAHGRKHGAVIRDSDPDSVALQGGGISIDPPDINQLDWDAIKTELHNALFDRGLVTYEDVVAAQNNVSAVAVNVLKTKIVVLYRQGG